MGPFRGTSLTRSLALGALFALLGLVASVSAFAAPFNDASTAARDQYTTTVTTPAPAAPPTAPNDDGDNAPDGAGGANDDTDPGDDDDGGVNDASDGADSGNSAPSSSSGSGAARPGAAGGSAGSARTAAQTCKSRSTVALLSIGDFAPEIGPAFVAALGLPSWSGSMDSTNPFAFASGPGCGASKFSGLPSGFDADKTKDMRELFRDTGEDIEDAGGLAGGLPGLLDDFDGSITPVTALVVSRSKIEDPKLRRKVEARAKDLIKGALKSDIPVVGIEADGTDPSSLEFFKEIDGASFVNDVDTPQGAESLKRLVAGAEPGLYGTGDDVDAKTPPEVSADRSAAAVAPAGNGFGLVGVVLLLAFVGLSGRALFTVVQRRA